MSLTNLHGVLLKYKTQTLFQFLRRLSLLSPELMLFSSICILLDYISNFTQQFFFHAASAFQHNLEFPVTSI